MNKIISTDWLRPSDNIWIYQDGDLMRAVARVLCQDEEGYYNIYYTSDRYVKFNIRQIILDTNSLNYEYRFLYMLVLALSEDVLGDVIEQIEDAYKQGLSLPKLEDIHFSNVTPPQYVSDLSFIANINRCPMTVTFSKHILKTSGIMITKENSPYKISENNSCTWDGEDWFYVQKIDIQTR